MTRNEHRARLLKLAEILAEKREDFAPVRFSNRPPYVTALSLLAQAETMVLREIRESGALDDAK